MYANAGHNIYTQNNVGVESPEKLIEMLYEGVLRFNTQAKKAIKDKDIEKRVYWINRSIAVITELTAILDETQGEVAQYLKGLYNYEINLLVSANREDNTDMIDEVNNVFKGLLNAWSESTRVDR